MNPEIFIRKRYIKRLLIWISLIAFLSAICIVYHSLPVTKTDPAVSVAIIMVISACLFPIFKLNEYLLDKPFAGKIINAKINCKSEMPFALERKIITRTYVEMVVECDNGYRVFHEELIANKASSKNPYAVGDRVYHIKGSKHTCRFRDDTGISNICPICGAIMSLDEKDCSFCNIELPHDPAFK